MLIVAEISHKEFIAIVDEKEEYEKMKENIKMMKIKKIMMLKKVNWMKTEVNKLKIIKL